MHYVNEKDYEFAKSFENFVNGGMSSPKTVAAQMAKAHRYLQKEMFRVCFEYIRILALNYGKGRYDARNEWACLVASQIVDNVEAITPISEYEEKELFERNDALYMLDLNQRYKK